MSITDADRERAQKCLSYNGADEDIETIAAALAEERTKARAPFLALLDVEPDVQPLWEFERGVLRGIEMTKAAIRRTAGDS